MAVVPINKKSKVVEGLGCVSTISALSEEIGLGKHPNAEDITMVGVSIITPPGVTRMILEEGHRLGMRQFFLQPGTYDETVDAYIRDCMPDCNVVKGCVLVDHNFLHSDD